MDIEMYNYVDVVLRKVRLGRLAGEVLNKSNGKGTALDDEKAAEATAKMEANEDDDDDETKKIDGI
jgi:hypothetical protein